MHVTVDLQAQTMRLEAESSHDLETLDRLRMNTPCLVQSEFTRPATALQVLGDVGLRYMRGTEGAKILYAVTVALIPRQP